MDPIVTTFAALITIMLLSLPLKETIFSRFAEFMFVGMVAGFALYTTAQSLYSTSIQPIGTGDLLLIIPNLLGLIILLRPFIPQLRAVAVWPLAMAISFTIGAQCGGTVVSDVWRQVLSTIKIDLSTPWSTITGLLVVGIVVVVLVSFTTTFKHEGITGRIAELGRWALLIAFGVAFGSWMMGRFGYIAGRMQFLITAWLGISPLY